MNADELATRLEPFQGTYTHQEITVADHYRLRRLWFAPDVIYDLGASRGIFTVFAHHVFPDAKIVAVEPHPENWKTLLATVEGLPNIECVNAAVGVAPIYYREGRDPGKHGFVSRSIGYSAERLRNASPYLREADVQAVTLGRLVSVHGGEKYLIKIDIEGAEGTFIGDPAAAEAVRKSTYTTMELHFWAAQKESIEPVTAAYLAWVAQFRLTHSIELRLWHSAGMAWMSRRSGGGT